MEPLPNETPTICIYATKTEISIIQPIFEFGAALLPEKWEQEANRRSYSLSLISSKSVSNLMMGPSLTCLLLCYISLCCWSVCKYIWCGRHLNCLLTAQLQVYQDDRCSSRRQVWFFFLGTCVGYIFKSLVKCKYLVRLWYWQIEWLKYRHKNRWR